MPEHSTAELHPDVARAHRVEAQQHLRIMIESMVRAGYSEPEITSAVRRSTASDDQAEGSATLWTRLVGLFQV